MTTRQWMLDHLIMLYRAEQRPGLLREIEHLAKEIMSETKNSTENIIRGFLNELEVPVSDAQVKKIKEFLGEEKEANCPSIAAAHVCEYLGISLNVYQKRIKKMIRDMWEEEDQNGE